MHFQCSPLPTVTLGIILGCLATLILVTGLVYGLRRGSGSGEPTRVELSTPSSSQSTQPTEPTQAAPTDQSSTHSASHKASGGHSSSHHTPSPPQGKTTQHTAEVTNESQGTAPSQSTPQQPVKPKICPAGFDPGNFDLSFFVVRPTVGCLCVECELIHVHDLG